MLGGKLSAYFLTGSSAIFSDAAESVIHLLATAFVGFSLWYSFQPADAGHPYGHGKIAYFSSGFEGILIIVAAVGIIYMAVEDLITGPDLSRLDLGIGIIAGLTAVNLALGLYLLRTGKKYNNLVIVSNGQHVLTDMWTSAGVLVGIGLVLFTGVVWLDPLVAIAVALNILWSGSGLLRRSVSGLMERAEEADTSALVNILDAAVHDGIISNFHQLRHRRIHDQIWVEYHLLFPEDLTITEAHERSHAVEDRIASMYPKDEVFVTAHLEPDRHDEAHPAGHAEPVDPLADADQRL
jgi:cation diffusion facilitator family transporter